MGDTIYPDPPDSMSEAADAIHQLAKEMRVTNALAAISLANSNAFPCGVCGDRPCVMYDNSYGPVCAQHVSPSNATAMNVDQLAANKLYAQAMKVVMHWLDEAHNK